MAGFDILSLVGEPWNDSGSVFRGIGVTVTDTASLPSSKFLEFVLNGASIYSVLKTGETIISNATGTSLGGIKLAGSAGEMALTSQLDLTTAAPAETLRYSWEDPLHVGNDPASTSVLQGMGASNFSIEGAATISHIAGNSTYAWSGVAGSRLAWSGLVAATTNGKTIDFTNVGQTTRASPIISVSANNVADDLVHFGVSDGTNWTVAAKIDAAGRGNFQMIDLPEQGAPGDPAATTARIYGKSVNGATKVAFRDSSGAETVLGSNISVSGGTVVANSPVASFSQTWNATNVSFNAIAANITDTQSSANSTLINLTVNADPVFQVRKSGETLIHSTGSPWFTLSADLDDGRVPGQLRTTYTGIVANWNRNNIGGAPMPMLQLKTENLPFFEITPNTVDVSENGGRGAAMLLFDKAAGRSKSIGFEHLGTISGGTLLIDDQRAAFMYWDGPVGGTFVAHFVTTNRTHFWSDAAFVHEAGNGRFEWESRISGGRISFVGFLSASAIGATFDFNNFGQTPTRASPVVSISSETTGEDLLHLGSIYSGGYTTFSRFDGTGALFAPQVTLSGATGTTPGMAARLATDTQNRVSMGLDASDLGVIRFGAGGSTAPDVIVARDPIPGTLGINNGTSAATLRIYRTYANAGADSEQWNLSWRNTTLVPWASIRTGRTGTGVVRNMCLEPALIGIGVPVGDGSNIPALKNAAGTLQIRKGNDSDFAAIRGRLTTADSAVPETIVPDSTLVLYDANGVAYKVPCVAA